MTGRSVAGCQRFSRTSRSSRTERTQGESPKKQLPWFEESRCVSSDKSVGVLIGHRWSAGAPRRVRSCWIQGLSPPSCFWPWRPLRRLNLTMFVFDRDRLVLQEPWGPLGHRWAYRAKVPSLGLQGPRQSFGSAGSFQIHLHTETPDLISFFQGLAGQQGERGRPGTTGPTVRPTALLKIQQFLKQKVKAQTFFFVFSLF